MIMREVSVARSESTDQLCAEAAEPHLSLVPDDTLMGSNEFAEIRPDHVFSGLRECDIPFAIARVIASKVTLHDNHYPANQAVADKLGLTKSQIGDYLNKGADLLASRPELADNLPADLLLAIIRNPRRALYKPHSRPTDQSMSDNGLVPQASSADTATADSTVPVKRRARVTAVQAVGIRKISNPDAVASDFNIVRQYLDEIGKIDLLTAEQEVELAQAIEVGVFAKERVELAQAGEISPLSVQDFRDLRALSQAGSHAYELFYSANLRLVVSLAKRYLGRGLDLMDLIQEGNGGLERALQKFDYKLGYKFSTYATHWIRQSLNRGIADLGRTIRLPVHTVERVGQVYGAQNRFLSEHQRMPTIAELSAITGRSAEAVKEILDDSKDVLSIEMSVGRKDGSDMTLGDCVSVETDGVENHVARLDEHNQIHSALNDLPPRAADIIRRRHGLITAEGEHLDEGQPFDEIAAIWNITPGHAKAIYRDALLSMKAACQLQGLQYDY